MFDRIGLKTKVRKKVGMVFRLCQAAVTQLVSVYKQRVMGTRNYYW